MLTLDPKLVASELMRLIEERTGQNQSRRTLETYQRLEEIEKVITPVLKSAEDGQNEPSAYELAHALDNIARQAITQDVKKSPTIDDEIATRDVVSKMMMTLKSLTEVTGPKLPGPVKHENTRRSLADTADSTENDDELVSFEIRIEKSVLRQALNEYGSM